MRTMRMPYFLLLLLAFTVCCFCGGRCAAADDGIFSSVFGGDYKVTGGSIYLWSEKKAVVIRDYATILLKGKRPNEWRRIRARNIIFFTDTNKIYAEGSVSVEDNSGTYLTCDRIYFDNKNFKGRARNVRMRNTDEGVNQTASVEEKDASVGRPTLLGSPASPLSNTDALEKEKRLRMNIQADDLRIVSKEHYIATGVVGSPSNYARPHWGVYSKAVHMRRGEKVEGFNNVVKIGNVPVFYLPYVIYDLKYRWPYYRTSGGYSNQQGVLWMNRVGWIFQHETEDEQGRPIKRSFQLQNIFADVDLRTNRGWGLGGESEYLLSVLSNILGKGTGDIRGYWTQENYIGSNDDQVRAAENNEYSTNNWGTNSGFSPALYKGKDRYMIDWWHRQEFNDNFDLRLQTHVFSDRDFFKEYFPEEWARGDDKSTNASLRYIADLFQTELVTQMRVNDFRTESEYLPEWRATLPGLRLGSLPIFLESQNNIGMVRKKSDTILRDLSLITPTSRTDEDGNTPWIGRAHTLDELAVPFDLGPVALKAHGGGFMTGYSDTYDNNYGKAPSKLNMAALWGLDASTRTFGYFDNDKLRHMIEPTLNLIGHEAPAVSRQDLYGVDGIDNYIESHMLTGGLYQDWQRKDSKGVIRRLFELNIASGVFLDQDEADKYNKGSLLSNVLINAAWYPLKQLALFGNGTYAPSRSRIDTLGGGFDYWFSKKWRLYANHQYSAGTYSDPYYDNPYGSYDVDNVSNLTTVALRTQLWNKHSHYSLEYALAYQWSPTTTGVLASDGVLRGAVTNGLQSQRISVIRDMDTFELSAGFMVDHVNNENGKMLFGLTPKGWVGVKQVRDDSASALDDNSGRYANPVAQNARKEDTNYNAQTPAWD